MGYVGLTQRYRALQEDMDAALIQLASIDWSARCSKTRFCLDCASAFCSHCCLHGVAHHGGSPWPRPLHIIRAYGTPAVSAQATKGWGYHTIGVQRLMWRGERYLLIQPQDPADLRQGSNCSNCGRKAKSRSLYCSIPCRLDSVATGARREMARALTDSAANFGRAIHLRDRFCTLCNLSFCSDSCPEHLDHHPGAGPGSIIAVSYLNGWPVVDAAHIPLPISQLIQSFVLNDGRLVVPIHRSPELAAVVPPDGLQGHPCESAACPEIISAPRPFCSLRCCHIA